MHKRKYLLLIGLALWFNDVLSVDIKCEVNSCDEMWWRSQNWLEKNAYFKVKQVNEYKLEAKANTPVHKSRMEYTLTRSAQGIELTGSCRSSIGCPSLASKKANFIAFVVAKKVNDSLVISEKTARKTWVDTHCQQHITSYFLRQSWLGYLYEEECADGGKRSLHVIRCRHNSCIELKPY